MISQSNLVQYISFSLTLFSCIIVIQYMLLAQNLHYNIFLTMFKLQATATK